MQADLIIPPRFNGPPESGNGGYSCGVVAAFIDGPARVRLHAPPPLDRPMSVTETERGVEVYDADTLVASAVPVDYELELPPAPSLDQARDAMARYLARDNHFFDTCFVCGPNRPQHDGLELFPGPVHDWNLLACVWHPGEDLLDANGKVLPEVIWAALDCPGYFGGTGNTLRAAVLGQLDAQLLTSVSAQPLIVYAWPLGGEGRKFRGGTAIATADGTPVASSISTWIDLKS